MRRESKKEEKAQANHRQLPLVKVEKKTKREPENLTLRNYD